MSPMTQRPFAQTSIVRASGNGLALRMVIATANSDYSRAGPGSSDIERSPWRLTTPDGGKDLAVPEATRDYMVGLHCNFTTLVCLNLRQRKALRHMKVPILTIHTSLCLTLAQELAQYASLLRPTALKPRPRRSLRAPRAASPFRRGTERNRNWRCRTAPSARPSAPRPATRCA